MSESAEYILRWRGRKIGPFSLPEINRRLDEHQLGMGHEIYYQERWMTLEEFFALSREQAAAAAGRAQKPPVPPRMVTGAKPGVPLRIAPSPEVAVVLAEPPATSLSPARPRRRLVYALLAVCLGFSGAHNFYARNALTGLLQLLLSIATSLLGYGILVSWLWALVEAVVVRSDGNGIEMI